MYFKKAKSFWQSYESVSKIISKSLMYLSFHRNKQCELMCKHRHKSHAMLKPFSDISFTHHSDTVRERNKKLHSTLQNYY